MATNDRWPLSDRQEVVVVEQGPDEALSRPHSGIRGGGYAAPARPGGRRPALAIQLGLPGEERPAQCQLLGRWPTRQHLLEGRDDERAVVLLPGGRFRGEPPRQQPALVQQQSAVG